LVLKILFLDDNINRREYARKQFSNDEYFEAETAEEAIKLLNEQSPFYLVSLDHDLGGKTFVLSNEESGYWVAKHIAQMPLSMRPTKVIIHTYNPAGSRNMMDELKGKVNQLIYLPFSVVQ